MPRTPEQLKAADRQYQTATRANLFHTDHARWLLTMHIKNHPSLGLINQSAIWLALSQEHAGDSQTVLLMMMLKLLDDLPGLLNPARAPSWK